MWNITGIVVMRSLVTTSEPAPGISQYSPINGRGLQGSDNSELWISRAVVVIMRWWVGVVSRRLCWNLKWVGLLYVKKNRLCWKWVGDALVTSSKGEGDLEGVGNCSASEVLTKYLVAIARHSFGGRSVIQVEWLGLPSQCPSQWWTWILVVNRSTW